jgi:hypothetical protein
MHTYDDAELSLLNRERHILISFSSLSGFGSYTKLLLMLFSLRRLARSSSLLFFAGSFKVHNMFHSYSGGKIIHLISLNRIKRQRVEKIVVQRRAVDDDI